MAEIGNDVFLRNLEYHKTRVKKAQFKKVEVDKQLTLEGLEKEPSYHFRSECEKKKLRSRLLSRGLNEFF